MVQNSSAFGRERELAFESLRTEVQSFRSLLPVIATLSRRSDLDRAVPVTEQNVAWEYLTQLRLQGMHPTELDIYEMMWDFMEVYRQFGSDVMTQVVSGSDSETRIN
jgi:hypothetical protein